MAKPITTRTIGPLHLEDLEPHRFEDLVRQLLYDFRSWQSLEPTGRTGADEGFDVLAIESLTDLYSVQEDDDDTIPASSETRTWLVQCKRERTITPAKLEKYLEDIAKTETTLYGMVFAAACEFSISTRNLYREKSRELGVAEAYLWGKGDIEDMLFQPKNDHLLFAYFGFSLQTRRRSLKTEVRARLATKRKAIKHLSEWTPILVRDASDDRYPYRDTDKAKKRIARGHWDVLTYKGAFSDGLHFVWHRHFAYLADDGIEWDFAETMDDGRHEFDNPWLDPEEKGNPDLRGTAMEIWDSLPERNRAWYEVLVILPYENILDIDEKGDEYFQHPHVYTTPFVTQMGPFRDHVHAILETIGSFDRRRRYPSHEKRIQKFVRPEPSKKKDRKKGRR